MNGEVDGSGRALLTVRARPTEDAKASELTVWVDTAFTGDLVIPRRTIQSLGLPQSAAVMAGLADGTQAVLESYSCFIEWFGGWRLVEVIESGGQSPLLGVGLLRDQRLEIDYRSRRVAID